MIRRKPRLSYRGGVWLCTRLGVVGRGATPREAWNAMHRKLWE